MCCKWNQSYIYIMHIIYFSNKCILRRIFAYFRLLTSNSAKSPVRRNTETIVTSALIWGKALIHFLFFSFVDWCWNYLQFKKGRTLLDIFFKISLENSSLHFFHSWWTQSNDIHICMSEITSCNELSFPCGNMTENNLEFHFLCYFCFSMKTLIILSGCSDNTLFTLSLLK